MRNETKKILKMLNERYINLHSCQENLIAAIEMLIECYKKKRKVLVCGNGGSAADAEHIVGELMKGFLLPRPLQKNQQEKLRTAFPETARYLISNLQEGLPTISLVSQTALMTAFCNDQAADLVFAQQVLSYGNSGDVLIAISTSGNSANVVYAAQVAKVQGMQILVLTGQKGGRLRELADILISVPSEETFTIQEYHLPIYHALCACVEQELFQEE